MKILITIIAFAGFGIMVCGSLLKDYCRRLEEKDDGYLKSKEHDRQVGDDDINFIS